MSIESMMYFALGALASALVMLMIMPAIWRRAVRLTKKRIEAATPITLAEFRADKDQLRAEFALSTRRLEMNVEALRKRLTEQQSDVSRKRSDLAVLKGERDEHIAVLRELEQHEQELQGRIVELEREGMELAQRLSLRDRQLEDAREALRSKLPPSLHRDGEGLSGNYQEDVEDLLTAISVEKKRAGFFETQARRLLAQLELHDRRSVETNTAMAELRSSLAERDDVATGERQDLTEAEVRIANAESRLNALLEQTGTIVAKGAERHEQLLAEKLSLEAQMEQLRDKVLKVESAVMADWDTERLQQAHLRERLNDIASDVSRLVYAVDNQAAPETEESLFDRVQRFADDGVDMESRPVRIEPPARAAAEPRRQGSSVADRMTALRELQGRQ